MTCRHARGDLNCTTQYPPQPDAPKTPDASNYEILEVFRVEPFLILRVKYPNCNNCSFEGEKVMVFEASTEEALKWKKIDPHFRDPEASSKLAREAPSPIARFPGNVEGWEDALDFARLKSARK